MATNLPDIPSRLAEDIVYEILLWLPVKSLLRLRSVCKSWLSLISSTDFIETHLSKSTNDPHFTHHHLILAIRPYELLQVDDDIRSLSVYSLINDPVPKAIEHDYCLKDLDSVVGYCHGLVCLTNNNGHDVILWNPSTRESRTLPKLDVIFEYKVHGFCYDESTDDFKVFVFVVIFGYPFEYKFSVYSSNSNSWRMIGDFPFELTWLSSGEFVNGAIHWFGRRLVFDKPEPLMIVSLDIKTEAYRQILPPINGKDAYIWTLGTFGKSLSVYGVLENKFVGLWVLKECGVKESWTKLYSVPTKLFTIPDMDHEPIRYLLLKHISLSVNGDLILLCGSRLQLYSSKDNNWKVLFNSTEYISDVNTYVESLVSPHL